MDFRVNQLSEQLTTGGIRMRQRWLATLETTDCFFLWKHPDGPRLVCALNRAPTCIADLAFLAVEDPLTGERFEPNTRSLERMESEMEILAWTIR